MKRSETIKDRKSFNNIIKNGKYKKNNCYVIYIMKSENEDGKIGIAISNKIGKAHIRNKLKRQTRAIIDANKKVFKKDNNYIIMIRKGCLEKDFEEKSKLFNSLFIEKENT